MNALDEALAQLRKEVLRAIQDEYRLEKINEDPKNQHCWDEWMRASGYLSGVTLGLSVLERLKTELTKP